jgi:chromosome segregation ATPase
MEFLLDFLPSLDDVVDWLDNIFNNTKIQDVAPLVQTGTALANLANNNAVQNAQDHTKELRSQLNVRNEDLKKKNEEIIKLREGIQEGKTKLEEAKALLLKQEQKISFLENANAQLNSKNSELGEKNSELVHKIILKDRANESLTALNYKLKVALIIVSIVSVGLIVKQLYPLIIK